MVEIGVEEAHHVGSLVADAGEKQDRDVGAEDLHAVTDGGAVEIGQIVLNKDAVDVVVGEGLHGLGTAGGGEDLEAAPDEHLGQGAKVLGLTFNAEDSFAGHGATPDAEPGEGS